MRSDHLAFVHIRRGDYLRWPSADAPAALPYTWYLNAIKSMQAKFPNCIFVLLSDDVLYLEDIFGSSSGFHISNNTPEVDLAIMSLCHSGILSEVPFLGGEHIILDLVLVLLPSISPLSIGMDTEC